jgi:hypothetical protein
MNTNEMQRIIASLRKYYRKRKRFIWSILICLFLIDLFWGLLEDHLISSGASENKFIFMRLESIYGNFYEEEEKLPNCFISTWNDVFTDKSNYLPYLWRDWDYIIPAPASINYIRKLLYKRRAAFLLFDMNKAPDDIKNAPNTIIIASPYPFKGGRMVYTVGTLKNLPGKHKHWMTEEDYQKQLKRQNWSPKLEVPPDNFDMPANY